MILVTGGNSQGKLAFVRSEFSMGDGDIADGAVCSFDSAFQKPVLNRLHLLVGRMMEAGADPEALVKKGLAHNAGIIVICDELGCGIVPMSSGERELRERVGRLQCRLAARAQKVYRVCCGIPMRIKGD